MAAKDPEGEKLLQYAKAGDATSLQQQLSVYPHINYQDSSGYTALIGAAFRDHSECVNVLLKNRANPDIQNQGGVMALMCASAKGHTDCVRLLLQHRANPNLQDKDGYTSLMYAVISGHTLCARLLLESNADLTIENKAQKTALDLIRTDEMKRLFNEFQKSHVTAGSTVTSIGSTVVADTKVIDPGSSEFATALLALPSASASVSTTGITPQTGSRALGLSISVEIGSLKKRAETRPGGAKSDDEEEGSSGSDWSTDSAPSTDVAGSTVSVSTATTMTKNDTKIATTPGRSKHHAHTDSEGKIQLPAPMADLYSIIYQSLPSLHWTVRELIWQYALSNRLNRNKILEANRTAIDRSPDRKFVKLTEVLGKGAFKTVYLGFDIKECKSIAWNTVNLARLKESQRMRIVDEIKILSRLSHPYIIQIYSWWQRKRSDEIVFITERCVDTLEGRMEKQDYGTSLIKKWCRQTLEALKYLHNEKPPVLHRDIKPNNIFLDRRENVKLGDFGLAKQTEIATTVLGTFRYMAPELREENYGKTADIWAFGITLLELAAGRDCYENIPEEKVGAMVLLGQVPHPPEEIKYVSNAGLRKFIETCLIKDPHVRPDAEGLLRQEYFFAGSTLTSPTAHDEDVSPLVSPVNSPMKPFEKDQKKTVVRPILSTRPLSSPTPTPPRSHHESIQINYDLHPDPPSLLPGGSGAGGKTRFHGQQTQSFDGKAQDWRGLTSGAPTSPTLSSSLPSSGAFMTSAASGTIKRSWKIRRSVDRITTPKASTPTSGDSTQQFGFVPGSTASAASSSGATTTTTTAPAKGITVRRSRSVVITHARRTASADPGTKI